MSQSISVIIPTYNRRELLSATIDSVLNADCGGLKTEIIVVDDGSGDGTAEFCRSLSRIIYIGHSENRGRAAARNSGLEKAAGQFVFLLDDDQIVPKNFFKAHLAVHDKFDDCVAAVGQYRTPEKFRDSWGIYSENRGPVRFRDDSKPLSAKYFQGGNVSIRRSVLEKAGNFDPQFDRYGGEDVDLGQRLKAFGALYFCRAGCSLHMGIQAFEHHLGRLEDFGSDGFVKLMSKHHDLQAEYGLRNFKLPRSLFLLRPIYLLCLNFYSSLPRSISDLCISYCIAYRVYRGYRRGSQR